MTLVRWRIFLIFYSNLIKKCDLGKLVGLKNSIKEKEDEVKGGSVVSVSLLEC
jgi:hypothetical protein